MIAHQGAGMLAGVRGVGNGFLEWLSPNISVIDNFGDFVFFQFVLSRLQHDIQTFGEQVLGRIMTFVGAIALIVVTLWVLIQGYRLMTGQLRESAMGLVTQMLKVVFIVAIALSFGAANDTVTEYLTYDMRAGIHELITGDPGLPEDEIDSNLGWMQVALASMDILDSGGDLDTNSEKERAQTWVGFGTGGPAITAGALLLMYEVAISLFVGLGPLFILCLLFDYTKGLFQKWLFYGVGTMFSMAVLSAMVTIALNMVTDVAVGMWASDALTTLIPGLGGGGVVSYSSRAMQTGAMGMILTLLLITVPPMAAAFFNGTMGSFMHYSAFNAGGGGGDRIRNAPGPGGPVGSPYGGGGGARERDRDMRDGRSDSVDTSSAGYRATPTYQTSGSQQMESPAVTPGLRGSASPSSPSTQRIEPTYTPEQPDRDRTASDDRRGR